MRKRFVGSLLILALSTVDSLGRAPLKEDSVKPQAIQAVLREASELALKQDQKEQSWTKDALAQMIKLQVRAGDFDGAIRSARGLPHESSQHERVLLYLTEMLARAGDKERALEVSRMSKSAESVESNRGSVPFNWAQHLITKNHLNEVKKVIEQIKSPQKQSEALRRWAVACANDGNMARANDYFKQAIEASARIKSEYSQTESLWEIAEAQRLVGSVDPAFQTLQRLADTEWSDSLAKIIAWCECGRIAVKLKNKDFARKQFGRAIQQTRGMYQQDQLLDLQRIAIAQANAGLIEDAQQTASQIGKIASKLLDRGNYEAALHAIAVAQIEANDAEGAVATALSIVHFLQYRDDSLHDVVKYYLSKQNYKAALSTTDYFDNPSRKAAAMLKVATAQAKAGDRDAAAKTANQIDLKYRSKMMALLNEPELRFSYLQPQSWGFRYDSKEAVTLTSIRDTIQLAMQVSAAAMELAQAMGFRPSSSYADVFDDVGHEVAQALARTHASTGDPKAALSWAQKIGSGEQITGEDRDEARWATMRRVHALIGVAEGMLERSRK